MVTKHTHNMLNKFNSIVSKAVSLINRNHSDATSKFQVFSERRRAINKKSTHDVGDISAISGGRREHVTGHVLKHVCFVLCKPATVCQRLHLSLHRYPARCKSALFNI